MALTMRIKRTFAGGKAPKGSRTCVWNDFYYRTLIGRQDARTLLYNIKCSRMIVKRSNKRTQALAESDGLFVPSRAFFKHSVTPR